MPQSYQTTTDDAHEFSYLAGYAGFGPRDGVPHWRCSCGRWRIDRDMRTGSPVEATARRKHRGHLKAVQR